MEHVVALHGFAGTGRMWDPVRDLIAPERATLWAPDLPGHGAASARRPADLDAAVSHVLSVAPERFVLAGYSMGGRIALHVALAGPERVSRLVLVATTAGIEDTEAREDRRRADEELAVAFEEMDIDAVADQWMGQPLFADDPPEARALQRDDVLRNDPGGLAAALRGLGAGVLPAVWGRLGALTLPVTVVVGERDAKYRALGARLVGGPPAAAPLVVVPGAGHGLPREAPAAVAAALAP